ncbi:MAG: hypothetical protein ACI4Q0_03815 [Oligosphaeraceae bacterium]
MEAPKTDFLFTTKAEATFRTSKATPLAVSPDNTAAFQAAIWAAARNAFVPTSHVAFTTACLDKGAAATVEVKEGRIVLTPNKEYLDQQAADVVVKVTYGVISTGTPDPTPGTATDRAGAVATLSLRLTITHVNRPPALAVDSFAFIEGSPLSWEDLSPSDPDNEDDDETLALHFSSPPQHGHFTDAAGLPIPAADLTAGLAPSRFPITFIPAPDAVNGENLSLYASDLDGATSPAIPLALIFHRQQIPVTQWWPSTTTENGSLAWAHLSPGWNLIASPVDLDAASLNALLAWLNADQLWLFRHGGFVTTASASAPPCAHEGFWVFLPTTPQTTDFAFTGNRPATPVPLPHGWSLRTREAILTQHPDHEVYLPQNHSLRLLNASDLPSPASPAWLYLP